MIIGKPAPFVSAFGTAVDEAIRAHQPSCGRSAIQRTWLAFCVTAVLVTNSIGWARFERARLGTYSLAALSWMFRHSKIPWDQLLVASVRVILRHHGLTSGSLVIDDTDNPRSKSAKALAYLYNSVIKFFVLDGLPRCVVAVSTDSAPGSALALSFFARPSGQLPFSHYKLLCGARQAKIVHDTLWSCGPPMAWRRRWLLESQPPS